MTLYNYPTITQVQNVFELCNIFLSSAFWLCPFLTKMNNLEMTAGNAFNLQDFEIEMKKL